jgi:hypothetical protein
MQKYMPDKYSELALKARGKGGAVAHAKGGEAGQEEDTVRTNEINVDAQPVAPTTEDGAD